MASEILKSYSIPEESRKLLIEGIVNNPLIKPDIPAEAVDYASRVKFEGSNLPSIPINWRFAESVSSLKGFEAAMVMALLKRKYGVDVEEARVNTDHAQLFFMSTLIWTINPNSSSPLSSLSGDPSTAKAVEKYFPSWDKHRQSATHHRAAATNIYKTKDGRFFHLHGSMNPDPTLESVGLPSDLDAATIEDAWKPFMDKLAAIDSQEMQRLASDVYKQAGTICWTAEEFAASEHGKANEHVGLYELKSHSRPEWNASWWPECPQTSPGRPLAGLKVVDLTRVIAAPAITRGLAELGASVMRVAAPHLVDFSALHCDLMWGKWNTLLDLREEADREKLRDLVRDADVVVTAYRPHVLDKYGFGEEGIMKLWEGRDRGGIYVRENCYGWNGPWAYRSGWQQISDACCGVSMEFGRAMGNDEAVTPVFPNSDYCTGIAGVAGTISALMRRAESGGSYTVNVALNYYSQWLVRSCGVYPDAIWQDVWARNGSPVFRHYHSMTYTIPRFVKMIYQNAKDVLLKPEFFEVRKAENRGIEVKTVKPVVQYPKGEVKLGFNVGTRTNGVDKPYWPKDLMVEVVA